MSIGINELYEMLNCNNTEEIQKRGIEEGKKIKHLSILFQPVEDKGVWENCAKIIEQQSDNILEKYLLLMFEWIQDANWPGYDIIYNRLKSMPAKLIENRCIYSIKEAIKLRNKIWISHLDKFIENKETYRELKQEEREFIKKEK